MMNEIPDNVSMNGKEFIEYTKYKQSLKKHFSLKDKKLITIGVVGSVAILGLSLIISSFAPETHTTPMSINSMIVFVGCCMGISWMLHGTGFTIVRIK